MDQHEFVAKCYARYAELGLEPGNPDDGVWQDAHYPAPKGEGDSTIPLLFNDHQIQGLFQSEEYGRCCFFPGHVRKFLTDGSFVLNWFELWDLYYKWSGDKSRKLNTGKSIFIDPETRESLSLIAEDAKARGLSGVNSGKSTFIDPVSGETSLMTSKEAKQRGWRGINHGTVAHNRKTVEIVDLYGSARVFLSLTEAAKTLGVSAGGLSCVCNGTKKQIRGYSARYLP
jgi:hypothetical protein